MSKRRKPGVAADQNKKLACAICGLPFLRERIQLWLMEIHFELWHDTTEIHFVIREKNTPLDVPEPIDMATAQEIQRTLEAIGTAITEARQATAEAHSARKELIHAVKDAKREIAAELTTQVTAVVEEMGAAAQEEMRTSVSNVISRLEADWRIRLGLEA